MKSVASLKEPMGSNTEANSSKTGISRAFKIQSLKQSKLPFPSLKKSISPFKISLNYRPKLIKTAMPKSTQKCTQKILILQFFNKKCYVCFRYITFIISKIKDKKTYIIKINLYIKKKNNFLILHTLIVVSFYYKNIHIKPTFIMLTGIYDQKT
jgi:hypothetical protein